MFLWWYPSFKQQKATVVATGLRIGLPRASRGARNVLYFCQKCGLLYGYDKVKISRKSLPFSSMTTKAHRTVSCTFIAMPDQISNCESSTHAFKTSHLDFSVFFWIDVVTFYTWHHGDRDGESDAGVGDVCVWGRAKMCRSMSVANCYSKISDAKICVFKKM